MRDDIRDLIEAIMMNVVLDDLCARDLADAAEAARRDGHSALADGLLILGRMHRDKSREGRARVDALVARLDGGAQPAPGCILPLNG
jgi:hypothetical protein